MKTYSYFFLDWGDLNDGKCACVYERERKIPLYLICALFRFKRAVILNVQLNYIDRPIKQLFRRLSAVLWFVLTIFLLQTNYNRKQKMFHRRRIVEQSFFLDWSSSLMNLMNQIDGNCEKWRENVKNFKYRNPIHWFTLFAVCGMWFRSKSWNKSNFFSSIDSLQPFN